MNGNLWIVAVLVVTLTVGALAVPATLSNESTGQTVTGEEHTLSEQDPAFLNNADEMVVLYDNLTVASTDGSTTYQEGDDYRVDYDHAQVYANDSTLNQTTVQINYSYQQFDNQRTQEIAGLFNMLDPIFGWVIILAIFSALFAMVGRS